jgi:hypothetical protein
MFGPPRRIANLDALALEASEEEGKARVWIYGPLTGCNFINAANKIELLIKERVIPKLLLAWDMGRQRPTILRYSLAGPKKSLAVPSIYQ